MISPDAARRRLSQITMTRPLRITLHFSQIGDARLNLHVWSSCADRWVYLYR